MAHFYFARNMREVGLPGGMNGRHLVDAARVVVPNLKVLFVTGHAENAVLSHGHLPAGMIWPGIHIQQDYAANPSASTILGALYFRAECSRMRL